MHPTSKHPVIAELNELVYDTFKPEKNKSGEWLYGRLYYYGDNLGVRVAGRPTFNVWPHWVLDGMTPVSLGCVLDLLEAHGRDTSKFRVFQADQEKLYAEEVKRYARLRKSAAAKLTADEREAVGL